MSYANLDGVPTQSAGTSEVLASDWNTYVRDNFDAIKFGHVVCTSSTRPSGIAEGTMIYETDTNLVYLYSGSGWSQNNFTPVGMISPFAGVSAPDGWLLCFGQVLNATADPEYASLWNIIGTTYGGSGIGAFNVPDLRGRAVAGVDNMGGSDAGRLSLANTLGTAGGSQTHTLTTAELAAHSHSINHDHGSVGTSTDGAHSHTLSLVDDNVIPRGTGTTFQRVRFAGSVSTSTDGAHSHSVDLPNFTGTSGSNGSGSAHNNLQPTMVLNYIIKY